MNLTYICLIYSIDILFEYEDKEIKIYKYPIVDNITLYIHDVKPKKFINQCI